MKEKLRLTFIAFLVGLMVPALAFGGTTGKISGVVKDADTGETVPGVSVIVEETNLGAVSDVDGYYFILNVAPGKHSVSATIIGYVKSTTEDVVVNADRTTEVNFSLKPTVIEVSEALIVTAERPLVEPDLAVSQTIVTPEETETLPAPQILEALTFEPGIELSNLREFRLRGGTADEISFQVDGLERTDVMNNRAYIALNSAMIKEIQIITGGFNAEYGDLRSGLVNVIGKEGTAKWSYTADYRYAPAHQKHFGPSAYGKDQYDYKLYGRENKTWPGENVFFNENGEPSYNPYDAVYDTPDAGPGGKPSIWKGWTALAAEKNSANWKGKNNWTPEQLQEVWRWRHKGVEYGNEPDQYLDTGIGGPLPFLNSSFYAGYRFGWFALPLPAIEPVAKDWSTEFKLTTRPTPYIKVSLNGLYGKWNTIARGDAWSVIGGDIDDWRTISQMAGKLSGWSEWGGNKYNLSSSVHAGQEIKQAGFSLTHTLNPSTFYEVRYNWFKVDQKTWRDDSREELAAKNPAEMVKTINGVDFVASEGWVESTLGEDDLPNAYPLGGEGEISDTSWVVTHTLNLDLTSQLARHHLVKAGFEARLSHIFKDHKEWLETLRMYTAFRFYDVKPKEFSGYIQDKIEYGGMIANIGLRVTQFDAGAKVLEMPDGLYSFLWTRLGNMKETLEEKYDIVVPFEPENTRESAEKVMKLLEDKYGRDAETWTVLMPRVSVSHPIGERTKFFFSYGLFYSTPKSQNRYGIRVGDVYFGLKEGEVRDVFNPDLKPPRTSSYEVGFEQNIRDEYVVLLRGYVKDDIDQIARVEINGALGSDRFGEPGPAVAQDLSPRYQTDRNWNYEDIRGIETKITKVKGEWVTGAFTFDYRISSQGNQGYDKLYQDPLASALAKPAYIAPPEPAPNFSGLISLHTPSRLGMLKGDWNLTIYQKYTRGQKYIYNPGGELSLRVIEESKPEWILRYADSYNTDLRLTKNIGLYGYRISLYMDVRNLLNQKRLNTGALTDFNSYVEYVVIPNDEKIGGKDTFKYLDEGWRDKEGVWHTPLAGHNEWLEFLDPRSIMLGIRISY